MEDTAVKITSFELENVKRIKAVKLEPKASGLTVIGGRNGQGKTSILDSLCWALGGKKYEPEKPQRDDSVSNPVLHVELSNGIVVERSGKSNTLKVTDTFGAKAGQALLDTFIETLALDLPKFMQMNDKEKAQTLLNIIGVGDKLEELDRQEASYVQSRLYAGRARDQAEASFKTMPYYPDAPENPVDIAGIAEMQRQAIETNSQNNMIRMQCDQEKSLLDSIDNRITEAKARLEELNSQRAESSEKLSDLLAKAEQLKDIDISQYSTLIDEAEEVNAQVRANQAHAASELNLAELTSTWQDFENKVKNVREERMGLLKNVDMPLEGLTVEDGLLVYNGHAWGGMSSSEQLQVATSIVRRLKPQCGFVLIDKLEQFDTETLKEFGQWCESEGLQIIGTRVSTGDECSIIIEDGMVVQDYVQAPEASTETYPSAQALAPTVPDPGPEPNQTLLLATGEGYAVPAPEDYAQMYGTIQPDNLKPARRF